MLKVDVIIPTFRRSVFLTRAIRSVLSQSYKNVHVIIVDDNNEGDIYRKETEEVMFEFRLNDRVKYLKHNKNKNGAAARNTGIKSSKAEFIAFLDDDDFFLPDKIQHQMDIINKTDNSWGGICCYHVRRYKDLAYTIYQVKEKSSGNYCYEFLSGLTSMPSSTLIIRSEVFKEVGLFDETFQRHQDLEFLVRFFRSYKMAISPNYDIYMQTEGFRNYPNSERAHEIKTKFLNKYQIDLNGFSPEKQQAIYKFQWFDIGCLYLRDRKIISSLQVFRELVFKNSKVRSNDIFKVTFFLLSGYVPFFKRVTASVLGKTKYRDFSGKISIPENTHLS